MKPLFCACLLLAAVPALADEAAKKAVERLIKDLDAREDAKRIDALKGLAGYGANARPALPAIGQALRAGPDPVRQAAARTLSRMATHAVEAAPALSEALRKDRDTQVR